MKKVVSKPSRTKSTSDKLNELVSYANKHIKEQWDAKTVIIKKILNITSSCSLYKDAYFFVENDVDYGVWLDVVKRCLVELSKIDLIQQIEGLYRTAKLELFPLLLESRDDIDKGIFGKSIALIRTLGSIYMLHGYYREAIELFKMVFEVYSRDFTTLTSILRICIICNDLSLLKKTLLKLHQIIQKDKLPSENYVIVYKAYNIFLKCHCSLVGDDIVTTLNDIKEIESKLNSREFKSITLYDAQIPLLLSKVYLKMLDTSDDGINDNYIKVRARISEKLLPSILYHYYKDFASNVPMDFDIGGKNDNFVNAATATSLLFEETLLFSRMLQDSGRVKECNIKCLQLVSVSLRIGCQYRFLSLVNTIGMSDYLVKDNPRIYDLVKLASNTFDDNNVKEIENVPPQKDVSVDSIYDTSGDYLSASDDSFDKAKFENLYDEKLNVKFHRKMCRCHRCKLLSINKLMTLEILFSKWLLDQRNDNSSTSKVDSLLNYTVDWEEIADLYISEWCKTMDYRPETCKSGILSKNSCYLFCGAIIKTITCATEQFNSQVLRVVLKRVRIITNFRCSEYHNMSISTTLISKKHSLRSYLVIPNSCYDTPLNLMNGIELALDEIMSEEANNIMKELNKKDSSIAKAFNRTINLNKQSVIEYIIAFNNSRLPPVGSLNYLSLRKYCNGKESEMLRDKVKEIFRIFTSNLRFMDVSNKRLILSSLLRVYDIAQMDEWEIAWIVSECTGVATRSLMSSTGSLKYYFTSVEDFKSYVMNHFPTNSTIIQLFMDDDNVLWLMKLHKNIKPLVIPLKKLHANYFNTIHHKFLDVHDKLTKESGQVSGRVFWSVRYSLEDSYKYICKKIQKEVLGSMEFLLLPYTELQSSCFVSFVRALEKVNYPSSVAISMASAIPFITMTDFKNILKDITTIYPMSMEIIQSLSSLFKSLSSKITRELRSGGYLPSNFSRNLSPSEMIECSREVFTTLILDNEISLYPWEMVSFFNYRPMITRMPSVINYALLIEKNNTIKNLDTDNSYYIINPKGDLKDTEDWMLNLLQNMKWEGIKGEWPKPEIVKEFTSKKDFLVYIGHGNGKQVFRVALKEQKFHSTAILMGCSSVRLGPSSNGYSHLDMVENYFTSSGRGILGCTILVTDREINKFFEYIFHKAFKNNNKNVNDNDKKTITYYVVKARESVRLCYLTAGSVVFYGIPTLFL